MCGVDCGVLFLQTFSLRLIFTMETCNFHYSSLSVLFLYIIAFNSCLPISALDRNDNPDIYLPTPGIIRRYGYPAETHTVQTSDGYLLGVHRIPHGRIQKKVGVKAPVIFLQHGFLGSSADWILTGPEKGLGFLLADKGYDVWLGNVRGNTYSRAHATLSPETTQFWQFSWDEMSEYDLPAEIDYILNKTGQTSLSYVGHSMGTTIFFAMTSTLPEYNHKINLMIGLAPVAFVGHIRCPIRLLVPWVHDLEFMYKLLGTGELLPQNKVIRYLAEYLCDQNNIEEDICANFLFILAGYDKPQLNETTLPVILNHSPAGTSTKTAIQFAQQIKSGKFAKFDYGKQKNQQIYNSSTPPEYSLKNVEVPVAALYANNDLFVSLIDFDNLIRRLPNVIDKFEVPYATFNHIDFVYAKDAPALVYEEIFKILKKLTKNNYESPIYMATLYSVK